MARILTGGEHHIAAAEHQRWTALILGGVALAGLLTWSAGGASESP